MSRVLLLTIRPEDDAAADEYAAVLDASGLDRANLVQHRLESSPLGDALRGVDAVVIGGSPFNVTEVEKSDLQLRIEGDLGRVAAASVDGELPVLFTCYGIGVLASYLGGAVDHEHGEPVGPVQLTLTAAAADDPLAADLPGTFEAFVGHKESVSRLPDGAVLLASSPSCPVQMFRVGTHTWATQFHPEPTPQQLIERARVYQNHGYFAVDELTAVEDRIAAGDVDAPRRLLRAFVERFA